MSTGLEADDNEVVLSVELVLSAEVVLCSETVVEI